MKDAYSPDPREEEQAQRVAYLISGYLRQSLTEPELDELDAWIVASDENQELFEELIDTKNLKTGILKQKGLDTEKALKKIKKQLGLKGPQSSKKSSWTRAYAIAASVIIIAGLFFFFRFNNKNSKDGVNTEITDLQPGSNKATLTLADGSIIDLTKEKTGLVKNENGTLINKMADGQLSYSANTTPAEELKYNTLITPRGGQYKIILPDGSTVWLNAASTLKYPVSFAGKERVVELTGEGYFEVTKKEGQTFKVELRNGASVNVVGTHFNINAYEDEAGIRTTLLEGSVNISGNGRSMRMEPRQQVILQDGTGLLLNKDVELQEVTAWKEGDFRFKNATIESIMRQVSRWYDVEISYEDKISYHFNATISRSEPVSKLFKILEMTKGVHFIIQGKKIIVKS